MKLRVARHTSDLDAMARFYKDVIGLEITGQFTDHDGYNGIFLSHPDTNWEIEFTSNSEVSKSIFDEDDLLVFYFSEQEFINIRANIESLNISMHHAKNPYWNKNGILIKDPDGFGVIISIQK